MATCGALSLAVTAIQSLHYLSMPGQAHGKLSHSFLPFIHSTAACRPLLTSRRHTCEPKDPWEPCIRGVTVSSVFPARLKPAREVRT